MIKKTIYLQIFDRELRTNERIRLSDSDAFDIVLFASLISPNFYVALSNLMESSSDLPTAVKLVYDLEQADIAKIISSSLSYEEFIERRRELYHEDKERYEMYFKPAPPLYIRKPIVDTTSTTEYLRQSILQSFKQYIPTPLCLKYQDVTSILRNHDSGITKEIISKRVNLDANQQFSLGREISLSYTQRYLEILQGCLILRIPGFEFYDQLSTERIFFDHWFPIIKTGVLRFLRGLQDSDMMIASLVQLRRDDLFQIFVKALYNLLQSLYELIDQDPNVAPLMKNNNIRSIIEEYVIPQFSELRELNSQQLFSKLNKVKYQLEQKISLKCNKVMEENMPIVLIVVATDTEMINVAQYYKEKGNAISHNEIGNLTFWDLGVVRNKQIKMVRTGMGAKTASGSILTIDEAIRYINPSFVIMVGIAFGLKEDKQKVGDILVASEIIDYGTVKIVDDKIIERGERVQSSRLLLDRFRNGLVLWNVSKVHIGQFITNDILVNNLGFVDTLKQRFPDAIGGEMEGCGLLAHKETDWILVKSICDFGHEKDDAHQTAAANSAISYVNFILSEFDF